MIWIAFKKLLWPGSVKLMFKLYLFLDLCHSMLPSKSSDSGEKPTELMDIPEHLMIRNVPQPDLSNHILG